MEAFLRTKDEELLKRIFAEKHGGSNIMGPRVLNFARQRLQLKLPVDPQQAEPFMKARVRRVRKPGGNYPTEALVAAELGYQWSASLLIDVIASRPVISPSFPEKEVPPRVAEEIRKAHLATQGATLVALQKLVKQDFGADPAKKPEEFVEAAAAKAKAWWAENSKDPRYLLSAEKPTQPAPVPAVAPAAVPAAVPAAAK